MASAELAPCSHPLQLPPVSHVWDLSCRQGRQAGWGPGDLGGAQAVAQASEVQSMPAAASGGRGQVKLEAES